MKTKLGKVGRVGSFGVPLTAIGRSRRVAAAFFIGTMLSAGTGVNSPALAVDSPLTAIPGNPQAGFAALVARVKPAVVQIATARPVTADSEYPGSNPYGELLRRYFGYEGQGGGPAPVRRGMGSGFIIDQSGYIVTANHVVAGAREVRVRLMDGSQYSARVVGRDPLTDVALVKVDAGRALPYVAFGDSDTAREGDWVVSVGNPYGLGGTVTAGIVSARGRNINEGPYDDFLQIDAPINPGNSGGPLFNQSGQVVGISTAIFSPSGGNVGIGFAVPSNNARRIVAQLREQGRVTRGWLGVAMQPLTPSLAKAAGLSEDSGVLVASITPGSPAERADLRQGDVITAFDRKPVKTTRDLALAVAETPSGRTVGVTVWRENRSQTINVRILSQQEDRTAALRSDPLDG